MAQTTVYYITKVKEDRLLQEQIDLDPEDPAESHIDTLSTKLSDLPLGEIPMELFFKPVGEI